MWKIEKLGKIDYLTALDYQNQHVQFKQNGMKEDFLLLLEHEPIFTMGKGADKRNILDTTIPVITTNRGGDLTYHGPGQIVGYVIMDLNRNKTDLHKYLRQIEGLIISVLENLDIQAYRIDGLTGVWAEGKKLASIGIGVKKGITMHGFALNINPDLSYFYRINPCGLDSSLISSVKELKNINIPVEYVESLVIKEFFKIFSGDKMIKDDIKKAMHDNKIVEFNYHSDKKGNSHRTGEPYEIKHTGESDKLYLWDYDRDEIRAFIVDNISDFKITDENFTPRKSVRG